MFTGIITDVGRIAAVEAASWGRRFRIATNHDVDDLAIGASIACSGPCLTVVAKGDDGADGTGNWFDIEATTETLSLTTASDWAVGTPVNLERALRAGDEMGGHVVSGHVDGMARIIARDDAGDDVGDEIGETA
ncbi:MAG: riboflavin synthase, partial [Alphaproteobacteria bacterium]